MRRSAAPSQVSGNAAKKPRFIPPGIVNSCTDRETGNTALMKNSDVPSRSLTKMCGLNTMCSTKEAVTPPANLSGKSSVTALPKFQPLESPAVTPPANLSSRPGVTALPKFQSLESSAVTPPANLSGKPGVTLLPKSRPLESPAVTPPTNLSGKSSVMALPKFRPLAGAIILQGSAECKIRGRLSLAVEFEPWV
ncbi:DNA repair and recombination RAD54B isoform X1 [Pelobates cultripes]|uniref:DNA repair and recombination RAD54B isoform X1 n=1 Tax=Pelobates cultripes TaxID=61616 RepID=A0AAD1W6Q4_PELCU|nr:DNA repair and recombination RAD54B isoform X1 [Pelobates cultripes]